MKTSDVTEDILLKIVYRNVVFTKKTINLICVSIRGQYYRFTVKMKISFILSKIVNRTVHLAIGTFFYIEKR